MVERLPFTKFEAVLLLDAYLKVLSGNLSRMESIKKCSQQLRTMAINEGKTIDDTYRNVNGISFQMASMESAYQGRTIMKPATSLFKAIVLLYRNDKQRYEILLKRAKGMASTNKNSETIFMLWLSKNVSGAQLSELYLALLEIEQQARKEGVVEKSLYENLDTSTVEKIKANIMADKLFHFTHKWQWSKIISALSYLLQFSNRKDAENNKVEAKKELTESKDDTTIASFVDFDNIQTMAFTKPISISYFEDMKPESSWSSLYVEACKLLLEDYPHIFAKLKEESLKGSDKVWIVDESHIYMLTAPKKLNNLYFVETKRNATDLMRSLKWLLDQCAVDYENVVIAYVESEENQPTPQSGPATSEKYYREDKERFYRWLKENQHMSEATCKSYVSAIKSAENFAEEHNLPFNKLYTNNISIAEKTTKLLLSDKDFIQYNNNQHNRFRAAIAKLLAFYGSFPVQSDSQNRQMALSPETAVYVKILIDYFPKGYRLDSTLDMKRFCRYYEEVTGKELALEQHKLEEVIWKSGIVYDGRLYMPQSMLSDEMRMRIFSFVSKCFEEGRSAVYYEALFQEFSEDLLDHHIYNVDMLRAYLAYYLNGKYYIGRDYLSKGNQKEVDPAEEIRQCLKQYAAPMSIDAIGTFLPNMTEDQIRNILVSGCEFVRNSKGEYFHVDSLELTENELEDIAGIIAFTIEERGFVSGNELYEAIRAKYPYIFEKNALFSAIGWRDALKYKLGDRFSFVGNIVSKAGEALSMSDVFAAYSKSKSMFTINELEAFANSVGSTIYFDSLYINAIRVSYDMFVDKNSVQFAIEETDSVIERFCTGDYMPLNTFFEFAAFPDASYPWTEYLLEQYVAFFSEKFYLMHGNYNKNCAVGAIVRKTCHYDFFDELVTDILACNDVPLNKNDALDYLVKNGYIARRSYTNIESLLINARTKRNQKEKS